MCRQGGVSRQMVESGEYINSAILTRDFPSRPEALSDIRRMVESAATHTRLLQESVEDFLTAVDEAAANAIRHGTPGGNTAVVRVTCRYSEDTL
ncbi:MAG: ATP-binding protein, partial [Armatimonadota bacterium]